MIQFLQSLSRHLSAIRVLVVLGSVSVMGLLGLQVYWVKESYRTEEAKFRQSVFVALDNVARQMASVGGITLPNSSVVKQLEGNYFVVNINAQIDANLLEHYLRFELTKSQVLTDFEYGIYDCSTGEVKYGGSVPYDAKEKRDIKAPPRTNLPKYDKFPYYFSVLFPQRNNYLVSQLDFWLVSTGIMVLVVGFFGYSLIIILRQKRLSEVQRDFINNMTHEFKTPISTISLAASIIGQPGTKAQPTRLDNYARIIKDESLRLNGLVERVLQLAKTDQQGLRLNPEVLELTDLLRQVADTFDLRSKRADGHLMLDIPEGPIHVKADRLHLTNLLYNLLDNATKYNQRPPELRLRIQLQDGQVALEVQDNGIGIPEKFQDMVFDRFYRVPTGNVHNVKGFGIGLCYVKLVATTHRWRLRLLSFPGQGSIFTVRMQQIQA